MTHSYEDEQIAINGVYSNTPNTKSNAEWIRDFWYSLQDSWGEHQLPESKRVELEHFIRGLDQAHKKEVEIAIKEERKRCVDAVTQVVEKYHLDARYDDYTSGLFWGAKEALRELA